MDGASPAPSSEKGTSRIVVITADGSDAKPITPAGMRARWPAWSPDGRRIAYYVESSHGAIWVADLASAAQSKLFDSGLTRTLLDWSPDGKEIAFVRGVGNELGIDALEVESGTVRRVLGGELSPGEPRWSPDGKKLLFSTHSTAGNRYSESFRCERIASDKIAIAPPLRGALACLSVGGGNPDRFHI